MNVTWLSFSWLLTLPAGNQFFLEGGGGRWGTGELPQPHSWTTLSICPRSFHLFDIINDSFIDIWNRRYERIKRWASTGPEGSQSQTQSVFYVVLQVALTRKDTVDENRWFTHCLKPMPGPTAWSRRQILGSRGSSSCMRWSWRSFTYGIHARTTAHALVPKADVFLGLSAQPNEFSSLPLQNVGPDLMRRSKLPSFYD